MNSYSEDFPILKRKNSNGKPIIYLDSAATSQKPGCVIDAMDEYYRQFNANVHRGIHTLAEEATAKFEKAREKIARFVGVDQASEIIFTRNTTESINLVMQTWGRKNLQSDDHIVLTEMEHHSNLVPWYMLSEEKKLNISFIPVNMQYELDLQAYRKLLSNKPKLVSFTHCSNVLGTINPVKEMIAMAHEAGAVTLVDGAQSVPHFPVNIQALDADFYAFSAHKMCGPTAIGILFGKKELLEKMPPFLGGGDMIRKVTFEGFSTNSIPYKFEAGTPPIAEAIGFGAAIDYLQAVDMQEIFAHETNLVNYAIQTLESIKGIQLLGPSKNRGGVVSFSLSDIHPHDVAQILDSDGVAIRAGHHCAMPLHKKLGLPATTRASFYLYNSKTDIDFLKTSILRVQKIFQ